MPTSFRSQSMEGVLIHPQKIMRPMLDKLMVQQQLKAPYKRWKHMVAVMCLNLTYRKQVKTVLPLLFEKYPTPLAYLKGRLKKFVFFRQRHHLPCAAGLTGPLCQYGNSHFQFAQITISYN